MTEPIQNRTRNRFQHRTPNRCGTRSGTTDQNQNQNQTVVKAVRGLSVAKKSIHRYCSRGPANTTPGSGLGTARVVSASVMDGHFVASDGGV